MKNLHHISQTLTDLFHRIIFLIPDRIDLICRNHLWTLQQILLIFCQLAVDFFHILHRVIPFYACRIHHMNEYLRAFHMAQEFMSQANALARTFHQTWNIRHHEFVPKASFHNTKVGCQCSKVVVCNLGVCVCYHGKQCGFPNIRETNQTNVRNQL